MKLKVVALLACLTVASIAAAQNIVPTQQLQVAPRPAAEVTQIDQPALELSRLQRENARLKEENAALRQRIEALTTLGGSEVHAYCPDPTSLRISRNTAGTESNCALSGYLCEPVSGLCRTSCQTSDMCAAGFVCDTSVQQCINIGSG